MRPQLFLSIFCLAALSLAGCLPESKYPLSTPSTSVIDPRLEGAYVQRDKDGKENAGFWHFHYRGVHTDSGAPARTTAWLEVLAVEHAKDGGLNTHRYEALTTHLGGHDYLSFIDLPDKSGKSKLLPYSFARYEVNWRGDLRIWLADNAAFATAIKGGHLRGKVTHGKFGDTVELTDTTEHLAAFVAASDPKVLFGGQPMVMRHLAR